MYDCVSMTVHTWLKTPEGATINGVIARSINVISQLRYKAATIPATNVDTYCTRVARFVPTPFCIFSMSLYAQNGNSVVSLVEPLIKGSLGKATAYMYVTPLYIQGTQFVVIMCKN